VTYVGRMELLVTHVGEVGIVLVTHVGEGGIASGAPRGGW
jgi:hypothetical protein